MSSMQLLTLRTFVNERLTAAAEEIFGVIERTMVEYREEVSRSVMYQCKLKGGTHRTGSYFSNEWHELQSYWLQQTIKKN